MTLKDFKWDPSKPGPSIVDSLREAAEKARQMAADYPEGSTIHQQYQAFANTCDAIIRPSVPEENAMKQMLSSRYYYQLRPPGIGCQPNGYLRWETFDFIQEVEDLPGRYHGFVEYPEPIDTYDAWRFDLTPADPVEQARMKFISHAGGDAEEAAAFLKRLLDKGEEELSKMANVSPGTYYKAALVILRAEEES